MDLCVAHQLTAETELAVRDLEAVRSDRGAEFQRDQTLKEQQQVPHAQNR